MLWFMDGFGGGLLWFLLARKAAWNDDSDNVRRMRLDVGSLTIGFLSGLACYLIPLLIRWFGINTAARSSFDATAKAWFAFAGLPLIWIALTFLLESLNRKIK